MKLPKDSSSLEVVHDSIVYSCMEKMINFDQINIRRVNHIKLQYKHFPGFNLDMKSKTKQASGYLWGKGANLFLPC